MTRKTTRLFIYGSLKRAYMHHGELAGGAYAGPARTAPGYALVRYQSYPAMVREGQGCVSGELYEVDARLLARLDEFEDCPHLYQRAEIRLSDGSSAQAYVMSPDAVSGCQRLHSECWQEDE